MKNLVRKALYRVAPDFMRLRAARKRRAFNQRLFGNRQMTSRKQLYGDKEIRVMTGPFAGMKYIDEITWGPIEPKWLGTYEFELHGVLDSILAANYRTVIDIGSAEGFYAVGLAWKIPNATVISFDIDPISRTQQTALASLNGVKNLRMATFCKHSDLQDLITDKTLIVCDIEGGEMDLLDPNLSPKLRQADILVELHEIGDKSLRDVEAEIAQRFSGSHEVTSLSFDADVTTRRAAMARTHAPINQPIADALFDELRHDDSQTWLWLKHRG